RAISLRADFRSQLHQTRPRGATSSIPKPVPASHLAKPSAARHRLRAFRAPTTPRLLAAWRKTRLAFLPDAPSRPLIEPDRERQRECRSSSLPCGDRSCDASPRPPSPLCTFRPNPQLHISLSLL